MDDNPREGLILCKNGIDREGVSKDEKVYEWIPGEEGRGVTCWNLDHPATQTFPKGFEYAALEATLSPSTNRQLFEHNSLMMKRRRRRMLK